MKTPDQALQLFRGIIENRDTVASQPVEEFDAPHPRQMRRPSRRHESRFVKPGGHQKSELVFELFRRPAQSLRQVVGVGYFQSSHTHALPFFRLGRSPCINNSSSASFSRLPARFAVVQQARHQTVHLSPSPRLHVSARNLYPRHSGMANPQLFAIFSARRLKSR